MTPSTATRSGRFSLCGFPLAPSAQISERKVSSGRLNSTASTAPVLSRNTMGETP